MPSGFFSSTAYLAHPGGTGSSSAAAARRRVSRRRDGPARGVATAQRMAALVVICVRK
jgi:hypothetical protein